MVANIPLVVSSLMEIVFENIWQLESESEKLKLVFIKQKEIFQKVCLR